MMESGADVNQKIVVSVTQARVYIEEPNFAFDFYTLNFITSHIKFFVPYFLFFETTFHFSFFM